MALKLFAPYIEFTLESSLDENVLRKNLTANCIKWHQVIKRLALGFDSDFNNFACRERGNTICFMPLGRGSNTMRAELVAEFEKTTGGTLIHISAKPALSQWLLIFQFLWFPFIILMFIFSIATKTYQASTVILLIPAALLMFYACAYKAKKELPDIVKSFKAILEKAESQTAQSQQ